MKKLGLFLGATLWTAAAIVSSPLIGIAYLSSKAFGTDGPHDFGDPTNPTNW